MMPDDLKKRLRRDFAELYYRDPSYTYSQIARILNFGVNGTPYEHMTILRIKNFHREWRFIARDRVLDCLSNPDCRKQLIEYACRKKKFIPRKKMQQQLQQLQQALCNLSSFEQWKRKNIFELNEKWKEFDGSWTEFQQDLKREFLHQ